MTAHAPQQQSNFPTAEQSDIIFAKLDQGFCSGANQGPSCCESEKDVAQAEQKHALPLAQVTCSLHQTLHVDPHQPSCTLPAGTKISQVVGASCEITTSFPAQSYTRQEELELPLHELGTLKQSNPRARSPVAASPVGPATADVADDNASSEDAADSDDVGEDEGFFGDPTSDAGFLPMQLDGEADLRRDVSALLDTFAKKGVCLAFLRALPLVHSSIANLGPKGLLRRVDLGLFHLARSKMTSSDAVSCTTPLWRTTLYPWRFYLRPSQAHSMPAAS